MTQIVSHTTESSISSSDDDEVKCLMANDAELESTSEQVFDFSSNEFNERSSSLHFMIW